MLDIVAQHALLGEALAKVCPIVFTRAKGRSVSIEFETSATPEQKAAAQAIVSAWDWNKELPKPETPLTSIEIRWVRDQMKAQVDALR